MTKKAIFVLTALCALALISKTGNAGTTHWDFKPTIPIPPTISEVVNSAVVTGSPNFTVVAKITGQTQVFPTCDKANQNDCVASDWYMIPSYGVSPNPPSIAMAKVYYYLNDHATNAVSVSMAADSSLGENKWKATVPIPNGFTTNDTITYYIVAVDSTGNVAAQVPDTGAVNSTCPSSPSSWLQEFATPMTNSCTYATSYTQCGRYVAGAPNCDTIYTMNDKNSDVCGQPDGNNNQSIISQPKSDILGISAAADKDYLCLNMGLGAAPPDANDPSPIEGYVVFITNPDKYDDNPADLQLKSTYALTYAPEMTATDPTLVRVLWDMGCVTDPNTSNILDCKSIVPTVSNDPNLQIGYSDGLKFIVKKQGTGNPYAVSYSLIGDSSKLSYIIGLTGELNMSGASTYWVSDHTPAMAFYQKNQTPIATVAPQPSPPPLNATKCSVDGTGGTSSTCQKSATKPAQNKCRLSWTDSLDASFVTDYKVYRNTTNAFTGLTAIATVPKTTLIYTDTIPQASLDGTKYYYFVSSYNSAQGIFAYKESSATAIAANVTTCTVEDWAPPAQPTITKAATPAGNDRKCKLDFTMPGADVSVKSFYMVRDNVPVNFASQMGADPATTSFSWTDQDSLNLNQPYSYKVGAMDLGDNLSLSSAMTCTPEDFKAPAGVATPILYNSCGTAIGINAKWATSTESDLGGYNVYWCKMNNQATDCRTPGSFTKINNDILTDTTTSYTASDPVIFSGEGDYCFYVEACDNCVTAGTCPSNAGNPNCSGFPSGGADASTYVRCLTVSSCVDTVLPAFPSAVTATAPAEGGKCKITWTKNYRNSDGSAFQGSPTPLPIDLVGYKIMRNTVAGVPTPAQASPVGMVALNSSSGTEFTDYSVTNGQTYYYTVYAIDGYANFSANGAGGNSTEVQCAPQDTIPPQIPVMGTPYYTPTSCTPNWAAVTDADPVTYEVYKCTGGATTCNATNTFTADADCVMNIDGLSCTDISLTTDQQYTFCVAASDPVPNNSAVYPAAYIRTNCAACTPSARPQPVTTVTAAPTVDQYNTNIFWTNSQDFVSSGAGGINVYRCADAACATKTKARSCDTLLANSSTVTNISAQTPLLLSAEPVGMWYYGVTYQSDCADATTESLLSGTAINTTSVTIIPPPVEGCSPGVVMAGKCITISSCDNGDCSVCTLTPAKCTPLNELDASTYINGDGTALEKQLGRYAAKSGVSVYLLTENGTQVDFGYALLTDQNGNFIAEIDNTDGHISPAEKYQIVLKINSADKTGIPCTAPGIIGAFKTTLGDDCGIQVQKGVKLTNGTKTKITLPTIPKAGQGRSEIGNINCDNTVDMKDFTFIKKNFNKTAATGMSKFADINQDGVVDMKDFTILKKNFGKCVGGIFDPATGACGAAGAPSQLTDLCSQ